MNYQRVVEPRASIAFEIALRARLDAIVAGDSRTPLAAAMRDAVLVGGSRFRPRLLLAVAEASGAHDRQFALHAAMAVELLHCASLVHDDLPAFDDAAMRRGAATIHRRYGEAIAILAGDALMGAAFETMLLGGARHPGGQQALSALFAATFAMCAGQAQELGAPSDIDVGRYHRGKTSSLFEVAARCGALAGHVPVEPWLAVGRELGLLYQAYDDLLDMWGDAEAMGKDTGSDARHARPSLVVAGTTEQRRRTEDLVARHVERVYASIPAGADPVRSLIDDVLGSLQARLGAPQGVVA